MKQDLIILGGGLSGISTAYFLQDKAWVNSITILEKEDRVGGLCRSLHVGGYTYDIGPHILFSKDKEMLGLMLSVLDGKNDLKRSNQIYYKGRKIQYPFENDLSKLPEEDLSYCIEAFNHNPYETYEATNMIQFFLKTFGEGITNTYLRPYNEKIWKYDPAFMNTSMVDRIPKPTQEEIRRSAAGETVEGYLHQLYFHFPKEGGIEAVVQGFVKKLNPEKCRIITSFEVGAVEQLKTGRYRVAGDADSFEGDLVVSTMPIQALTKAYGDATKTIKKKVENLRYNSILIAFVKIPYDLCGENYAFMIPDKNVIFHRISKMDFMGEAYHHGDEATYMVEVTYRHNDIIDVMDRSKLAKKIKAGLVEIGFAKSVEDAEILAMTEHEYAYVIYDLHHSENMEEIRKFYQEQGIVLNGRFGNFEYWNMDRVLRESLELSQRLQKKALDY